jgi:hypothetical protein
MSIDWIDVKKEKPKDLCRVKMLCADGKVRDGEYHSNGVFHWLFDNEDDFIPKQVTHWKHM